MKRSGAVHFVSATNEIDARKKKAAKKLHPAFFFFFLSFQFLYTNGLVLKSSFGNEETRVFVPADDS